MNKKRIFLTCAIFVVILSLFALVACDDKDGGNTGNNGKPSFGFYEGSGGTVEDKTMSLEVGQTVETIDLIDVIYAKNGATFTVCEDEEGKLIIPDKKVKIKNGGNKFYVHAKIGKNTTVYTLNIWKNFKAYISYYVNGEIFDSKYVVTHTYLDDFRAPEDLPYGIEFLGWDCEGHYVEGSKSFYAKLKYKTTNITLDADGGVCSEKSVKANLGGKLSLPVPTKEGYSFVGWAYDSQKVTDNEGKSKENWTVETNATLTALWQGNKYKVNFVTNNDDVCTGVDLSSYDYDEKYQSLFTFGKTYTVSYGTLKKLGYKFLGWFKDNQKIGDGYELIFTPESREITIEMRWEYDINLDIFDYYVDRWGITITGVKDKTLTTITIPQGVYKIEGGAFYGLGNLQDLTVRSLSRLGSYFGTYSYSGSVQIKQCSDHDHPSVYSTNYYIPQSLRKVTVLGGEVREGAFENCTMLTEVVINDVTYIDDYAFNGCTSLKKVVMNDTVTSIGKCAFKGCTSLAQLTLSEKIVGVGVDALEDTLWYQNQQDGLIYIGTVAYKYKGVMSEPTTIVLRNGTTSISEEAFADCNGMFNILIPKSVLTIAENTFAGCTIHAFCETNVKPNYWNVDWLAGSEDNRVFWGVDLNEILQELLNED